MALRRRLKEAKALEKRERGREKEREKERKAAVSLVCPNDFWSS